MEFNFSLTGNPESEIPPRYHRTSADGVSVFSL